MPDTSSQTAIPILIGGAAVVIGGVGLLASRKLRRKSGDPLSVTDLTSDEWRAAVEFEDAEAGTSA